ncbi:MAG: type II secretion system protein [Chloroherpetonaceae bacterium]|nr:type II secretion system GspH family protein [Chthonomonadaceae bacterium]MDW8207953.1 type II secretion system protein [Chloroherpetonaceae bacterium]
MTRQQRRRAFTMVELLTVIAVIAILAAVLFPIFGTVREQARQASTMSNMHDIYVAARMFYEDEGRFPNVLFGYAEVPDTSLNPPFRPALPGEEGSVVPMEQISGIHPSGQGLSRSSMFREQVKNVQAYFAGSDQARDRREVTVVYWPVNSPIGQANGSSIDANGRLVNGVPVRWYATDSSGQCTVYGDSDLPNIPGRNYVGQAKLFYRMDAMDIGPMVDAEGRRVTDQNGRLVYELHYTPDWTHLLGTRCDVDASGNPYIAQLKYRNPPRERTILTYNTHHVAFSGSPYVLVLRADGVVRKMHVRDAVRQLPLNYR